MTDPIADYLTRVRNAIRANHRVVTIPASNVKKDIPIGSATRSKSVLLPVSVLRFILKKL